MRVYRRAPWWVVISDIALINICMILAYWMRYKLQWFRDISYYHPLSAYIPFCALFTALMLLNFYIERVYQHWQSSSWLDQVHHIINAVAKSVVVLFATTFFLDIFRPLGYSRALFLQAGIVAILLLSLGRLAQNGIENLLHTHEIGITRVIIIGAGEIGRTVMRTIVARPELGYRVIGFMDDNPEKGSTDIGRFKALGPLDNLPRLLEENDVNEVIITLPWVYYPKIMAIVRECEKRSVSAHIVPDLFQMSLSRVDVNYLGGIPLIGVRKMGFGKWALIVKRVVDVIGAAIGLIISAPLFGLLALAIRLDSPGPIVFRQTRVGAHGKPFEIYKFRSMYQGAEEEQEQLLAFNEANGPIFKMRDDPRRTRVGRLIRRFSLDELPQFWNVLRGDMSLVGPRPPTPNEVAEYQEWHKRRLDVRPGMTGLWQVSGRSLLSFDETALLDIYYIENWSLWLDFKILLRTIPTVLFAKGAY